MLPYECTQSIQWLGYGLDDRGIVVWFPAGARDFYLIQNAKTTSRVFVASYLIGTGSSFLTIKVLGCEAVVSIHLHGMYTDNLYLYIPTAGYLFSITSR